MAYRYIIPEQDEHGIVTVTLNDAEAKNAVSPEMNEEIVAEVERIDRDPSARVMILTGSGRIFCSGGNIKKMIEKGKVLEAEAPSPRDQLSPIDVGIRKVVHSLRRLSKPAIAAVNGPAVGSGIGLAAGCDIRIASSEAKFGWVFVRRGIVPDDMSLALVQQLIGYANAFEWGVTGRTIDAARAKEIGFVGHVVAPEQLMATSRALALEISQNCPPLTVQTFKLVLGESIGQTLEDSARLVAKAQEFVGATEDHHEALRAYGERRAPVWKGR